MWRMREEGVGKTWSLGSRVWSETIQGRLWEINFEGGEIIKVMVDKIGLSL